MKIAILDDYQDLALRIADWSVLEGAEITVFNDTISDESALVARLKPFAAIAAMRERTPFPRSLLESLPNLKLLVTTGMRNASIDLEAAAELGITVSGTGGVAHPTAELTWGLILALCRSIPVEHEAMRQGGWQTTLGLDLKGRTLGVIGLGRLGSQVAKVGNAFGMNVVAWSENLTAERAAECGATLLEKEALVSTADIITLHLVLSERSRGTIGPRELALMKPTAVLINTSRGPIIEQWALVSALKENLIAGAALDVYDEEPLAPDHPLRSLSDVVLTPHLGYVTEATYETFYLEMVEDIAAFMAGKPIRVLQG